MVWYPLKNMNKSFSICPKVFVTVQILIWRLISCFWLASRRQNGRNSHLANLILLLRVNLRPDNKTPKLTISFPRDPKHSLEDYFAGIEITTWWKKKFLLWLFCAYFRKLMNAGFKHVLAFWQPKFQQTVVKWLCTRDEIGLFHTGH